MKKRWGIVFGIVALIAIIGAFVPFSNIDYGTASKIVTSDVAWMLIATALVLFMTPGLSFFYGGMVSYKNVISTMIQSFICLGIVSLLWYVVGFSLAFGDDWGGLGIIGNPWTFFMFRNVGTTPHPLIANTIPLVIFALFQLKFAIITPALITGSFAERVRFSSYILFITLFSLLIYAPLAHMTWHPEGIFFKWGVLDFAGGTVVHMSAGFAALAGAIVMGSRGEYSKKIVHQASNIPFVILGTGMLWFGWFGFNAGSALAANGIAAMAFATTNTASATAMIAWILLDAAQGKKISAMGACIGAVVGLVAITPAAGYVSIGASVFIGFTAACVSNFAVAFRSRSKLDDTLDVFPCHGVGGIVGMILTGVFASKAINPAGGNGLLYGGYTTFGYHMLTLGIVSIFAFGGSVLLYKLTNAIIPLRVSRGQEEVGLDISQHGEYIYAPPIAEG